MSVTVYGASDDLIEIEGDVDEELLYRDHEYGPHDTGNLLAFSDGTVLHIEYTQSGVWRIKSVATGRSLVELVQAPENDNDNYSDRATLLGDPEPIRWVVLGSDYAVSEKAGASG